MRTLTLQLGKLKRLDQEYPDSKESRFTRQEISYWEVPEYGHDGVQPKAWVVYDFEIGESSLPDHKGASLRAAFKKLVDERELVHPIEITDAKEGAVKTGKATTMFFMRGFADRIDRNGINGGLRTARFEAAREVFQSLSSRLLKYGELNAAERRAVDRLGTYPFTNLSPDGRAMNRSVVLFEIFRFDHDPPPTPEELEERARNRVKYHVLDSKHAEQWLEDLPLFGAPVWACMFKKLARMYGDSGGTSHIRFITRLKIFAKDYLAGDEDLATWVQRCNRDRNEIYFSERQVRWICDHVKVKVNGVSKVTLNGIRLPEEGKVREDTWEGTESVGLVRKRSSLFGSLIRAFANTPGEMEGPGRDVFFAEMAKVQKDIRDGPWRLGLYYMTHGGPFGRVGAHPGWSELVTFIQERYYSHKSIYSCYSIDFYRKFFDDNILNNWSPFAGQDFYDEDRGY